MNNPMDDDDVGLIDGIATTRAIRRIKPDKVSDEALNTVLFAATRAPSGSNRQPFRFLVLRDGPKATEAKALLGNSFRSAWSQKQAVERYESGSGADPSSPKARMARSMQHFVDHFEQIPVVLLACLVRYRDPTPLEGASIYPACQNLLLAARALGLGGVMTEWHMIVERELRDLLGIPERVAISATIPLGWPEGRHGPVRRRPLNELVYEDEWDAPTAWAVDPPGTRTTQGRPRG